jgi:hypothetical protein
VVDGDDDATGRREMKTMRLARILVCLLVESLLWLTNKIKKRRRCMERILRLLLRKEYTTYKLVPLLSEINAISRYDPTKQGQWSIGW